MMFADGTIKEGHFENNMYNGPAKPEMYPDLTPMPAFQKNRGN
jgi:hypothetical protein